jgi:hypothetical protein
MPSPGPVGVSPVLDAKDNDLALSIIDAVEHAVGAMPSSADAGQVSTQLLSYAMRVLQKGASELEDCHRHRFRKT